MDHDQIIEALKTCSRTERLAYFTTLFTDVNSAVAHNVASLHPHASFHFFQELGAAVEELMHASMNDADVLVCRVIDSPLLPLYQEAVGRVYASSSAPADETRNLLEMLHTKLFWYARERGQEMRFRHVEKILALPMFLQLTDGLAINCLMSFVQKLFVSAGEDRLPAIKTFFESPVFDVVVEIQPTTAASFMQTWLGSYMPLDEQGAFLKDHKHSKRVFQRLAGKAKLQQPYIQHAMFMLSIMSPEDSLQFAQDLVKDEGFANVAKGLQVGESTLDQLQVLLSDQFKPLAVHTLNGFLAYVAGGALIAAEQCEQPSRAVDFINDDLLKGRVVENLIARDFDKGWGFVADMALGCLRYGIHKRLNNPQAVLSDIVEHHLGDSRGLSTFMARLALKAEPDELRALFDSDAFVRIAQQAPQAFPTHYFLLSKQPARESAAVYADTLFISRSFEVLKKQYPQMAMAMLNKAAHPAPQSRTS